MLKATALTLKAGSSNVQLYAALRNEGDSPACGAAFSVELFDAADQPVGAGVGGLLVKRFYRVASDAESIAACIAPGDVTMIALADLSTEASVDDVSRVEYWCNYWALEVVPIGVVDVTDVRRVDRADGATFSGLLTSALDAPLPAPAVAVFPLNEVGRPLGVALAAGTEEVAPHGSWAFETDAVADAGVDQAAFPTRGP